MGSIDIIKPLSTVLSNAINESQQHYEKNSWEHQESNPGLLDEKQKCYLCAKCLILCVDCCHQPGKCFCSDIIVFMEAELFVSLTRWRLI